MDKHSEACDHKHGMSNQKIIILGAGGFIGRNLAERLIRDGHSPVLIIPEPILNLPSEAHQVLARVTDFETLNWIVELGSII